MVYIPLSMMCSHTIVAKIHIIFEMATFLRKNPQPLQDIFQAAAEISITENLLINPGKGMRRSEQQGDAVDEECHEPGEDDGVDGGADGPFPAAGFLLYGDECGDAREIEQDKHHEGKG